MSSGPGAVKRLWYRWKALRLPWRRQFLVGADLVGNTFWEFKDALNANRWRRIVRYSRQTHYADVKITPQWHQWLRHTRDDAPSIQEQQHDLSRQAMMKQLAAEADERWRSIPSYLDSPARQQPAPALAPSDSASHPSTPEPQASQGGVEGSANENEVEETSQRQQAVGKNAKLRRKEGSPWKIPQRGAPSENWQPESWSPGVAQRK